MCHAKKMEHPASTEACKAALPFRTPFPPPRETTWEEGGFLRGPHLPPPPAMPGQLLPSRLWAKAAWLRGKARRVKRGLDLPWARHPCGCPLTSGTGSAGQLPASASAAVVTVVAAVAASASVPAVAAAAAAAGLPSCAWAPSPPAASRGAPRGFQHRAGPGDPSGPPGGACEHRRASQDAGRERQRGVRGRKGDGRAQGKGERHAWEGGLMKQALQPPWPP